MTVNELIAQLQALSDAERQREVWVEINVSGGGYSPLEEILTDRPGASDVIVLSPEA